MILGLAFIVNRKWNNKIYKLGKLNDRIPVLGLATSRSENKAKTKPRYESRNMVLYQKLDSKLD